MKNYKNFNYYELSELIHRDDFGKNPNISIFDKRNAPVDITDWVGNIMYTDITVDDISEHSSDENYYEEKIKAFIDNIVEESGDVNKAASEVDNTETDITSEEVTLADAYTVNFSLSYSQYLKGQNKTELTNEDAAAFIASLVSYYENEAPVSEVKQFFEIPDIGLEQLENRHYNISTEVVSNEADYQILLVKYTLTFGDRVVPEKVEDISPVEELVQNVVYDLNSESEAIVETDDEAEIVVDATVEDIVEDEDVNE